MPIRKRKPTSPGRRFQTVSDFAEVTKRPAREVAHQAEAAHRRSQLVRPHDVASPRRRPQAAVPRRRLPARTRTACPRRSPRSSTTRTATRASRCCTTSTARSATSSPRSGVEVGDMLQSGQGSEIRPGNALPLRYIPVGTDGAQRRAEAGRGRQDRPRRRRRDPARRQGRRVRHAAPPVHRDAARADRLPRHRRFGRQQRGRPGQDRQGRSQPLEGQAPARAWRRHEPGRPPARWRRGQELRRSPPGVAVGQARRPHPQEGQEVRRADHPPPPYAAAHGGKRACRAV